MLFYFQNICSVHVSFLYNFNLCLSCNCIYFIIDFSVLITISVNLMNSLHSSCLPFYVCFSQCSVFLISFVFVFVFVFVCNQISLSLLDDCPRGISFTFYWWQTLSLAICVNKLWIKVFPNEGRHFKRTQSFNKMWPTS